jgi:hypothetical protein
MIQCILFISLSFWGSEKQEIVNGYMGRLSVKPGESVDIFLNSESVVNNYRLKLYDLGGNIVSQVVLPVFPQKTSSATAYQDGFGYRANARITVPNLKSGIYLWENKVPMLIRANNPKIIVLYSSNTGNAYCSEGGKSLYGFNSSDQKGAVKVSFFRPVGIEKFSKGFLEWMYNEKMEGVGYIDDQDMDDYNKLKSGKLLIVTGHSEYWTVDARRNFDRFVNEGNHAMVLSGNTMWWQVRYNASRDQLICYRKADIDPIEAAGLKTILWSDSSLHYPILSSIGADYNYGGYGNKPQYKGYQGYKIAMQSPLLENTTLKIGDIVYFRSAELDGAPLKGFDKDGIPIIDKKLLGFYRIELVGYDLVQWKKDGVATWIVFKAKKNSGTVINVASTDWCSADGIGSNKEIQKITSNMILKLIQNRNVFTPVKSQEPIVRNF